MKNLLTPFLSSAHLAQCPEMNQSLQMFVERLLHWWHRTQAPQTLPPRAQNSKYCGRWGSGKPRCLSGPVQMIKSQLTDRNTPAHDSPFIFSRLQRQDLSCKPSQRWSRAPERLLRWKAGAISAEIPGLLERSLKLHPPLWLFSLCWELLQDRAVTTTPWVQEIFARECHPPGGEWQPKIDQYLLFISYLKRKMRRKKGNSNISEHN